ncbi:hypothetical protein CAC42_7963 [Sphaceloma murrayae]|uniref:Early meiotic induction protein 1 n=1 Tax=Sphaceloma murrayae TaxID=2082308 RepID=A0A2K1QY61_9PEZI|nr:hypothetical protein CAC42_7963 [Sphaceloma murrayae]
MGWWPFSSSSPSPSSSSSSSSSSPLEHPSDLLPPTTPSSQSPPPTNRDQQAEAELNAFLASLESPSHSQATPPPTSSPLATISPSEPTTSTTSTTSTTAETPSTSPHPSPYHPSGALNISPSAIRPRSMNCRTLFDSAFYCASLGGKFNDIYRFGSLQPCSEHWDAFWFCMRTKSYGEKERGELVAQYYEEREEREKQRRSQGRSSEDVWEMRTEAVEKAFWKVP